MPAGKDLIDGALAEAAVSCQHPGIRRHGRRLTSFDDQRLVPVWVQRDKWEEPEEHRFSVNLEVYLRDLVDGLDPRRTSTWTDPHWWERITPGTDGEQTSESWVRPRSGGPDPQRLAHELAVAISTTLDEAVDAITVPMLVERWWHRDLQNTTAFSGSTVNQWLEKLLTKDPELDVHT